MVKYAPKDMYSLTDLRKKTKKIVDSVKDGDDPILLIDRSKPFAVIVKAQRYEELVSDYEDLLDAHTLLSFDKKIEKPCKWASARNDI